MITIGFESVSASPGKELSSRFFKAYSKIAGKVKAFSHGKAEDQALLLSAVTALESIQKAMAAGTKEAKVS